SNLVLLRHGQTIWNLESRFTGWADIDLSERGIQEAHKAGKLLKKSGYSFDSAYTSVLKRAIRTLWIVMDEMDLLQIPVHHSWRLNEMCLGALQGSSKDELIAKYGAGQVHDWCRGYHTRPPALKTTDQRHPSHDLRYAHLKMEELPSAESLKEALDRLLPLWEHEISSDLQQGKKVFILSHGNILRTLVKHIDNIPNGNVEEIEVPNGTPLVYEIDKNLRAISRFYLR
ncbi:MAG: 2,3-diphosphoglycerate-dependent phosphoglycerate mutase, partial [Methanotrichaceae archaeon]